MRVNKEDKTKAKAPFKGAENIKPNKLTPSNKNQAQKVAEIKKGPEAKTHKR